MQGNDVMVILIVFKNVDESGTTKNKEGGVG